MLKTAAKDNSSSQLQLQQINWNHIQKQELIGSGGFGEVYKGIWHGQSVAIKQLHLKQLSKDLKDAFYQEALLLAKCHFPNIVQLYGVSLESGHYSMVMEYLPKGSLYHVLHNLEETLPWNPLRWQIALNVGKGLSYLHSNQIVHRDLKSLNILLDENYRAKITDFGMARIKLETNSTTTNQHSKAMGSTRWMAPELFKRRANANYASDVYSYGIVLWEIATRKLPFADAHDDVVVATWLKDGEKEDIPTDISKPFAEAIEACWREADKRPEAAALVEQLSKALPAVETDSSALKSWHFSSSIKSSSTIQNDNNVSNHMLIPASKEDVEKVVSYYQHHPISGMDIKSVQVIYNPKLNRAFELRLGLLQQRANKAAFAPKWQEEANASWRKQVYELLEKLSLPYQDEDYPNVKLLPMWHGTHPSALPVLFETGYANLASTDTGFFGKGIYSSYEAEYAHRVYSKGALILNWVSCFSAYPTIDGDMAKLESKGNFLNYDAHFVPVVPPTGKPSTKANVYYPCKPDQAHQYIEMVVFDAQQCLPRYMVELQPTLPSSPKLPAIETLNINKTTKPLPAVPANPVKRELLSSNDNQTSNSLDRVAAKAPGQEDYEKGYALLLKNKNEEAFPYFIKAAKAQYPSAYLRLVRYYSEGGKTIGSKDETASKTYYQKAASSIDWFIDQANKGQINAQVDLGWCYISGCGVTKDEKQAFYWWQKAAKQGNAPAQVSLGWCYGNGVGIALNHQEEFYWHKKSAEQNFALGLYNLGRCYLEGRAVIRDEVKAMQYYLKAAEQGNKDAQSHLGKCYEKGEGVDQDIKQAVYWHQKAAEQGHAYSQYRVGYYYDTGTGLVQDIRQAVYWYQRSAEQGEPFAQACLGISYLDGKGVKQDLKQATYWTRKAAEQGFAKAQYNLGCAYSEGTGIPEDHQQAVYWYRKAAEQGFALAQHNLACCYHYGQGVKPDLKLAVSWYHKAAEQGHNDSQYNLGYLYCNGEEGVMNTDVEHGVYWFRKAAEQGHMESQYNLGMCYYHGVGTMCDDKQAVFWLQKAAAQGHQNAITCLNNLLEENPSLNNLNQNMHTFFQQSRANNYSGGSYNSPSYTAPSYKKQFN